MASGTHCAVAAPGEASGATISPRTKQTIAAPKTQYSVEDFLFCLLIVPTFRLSFMRLVVPQAASNIFRFQM